MKASLSLGFYNRLSLSFNHHRPLSIAQDGPNPAMQHSKPLAKHPLQPNSGHGCVALLSNTSQTLSAETQTEPVIAQATTRDLQVQHTRLSILLLNN